MQIQIITIFLVAEYHTVALFLDLFVCFVFILHFFRLPIRLSIRVSGLVIVCWEIITNY